MADIRTRPITKEYDTGWERTFKGDCRENSATPDPGNGYARAVDALERAREEGRREGIEEAARVVNARKQSIAVARDRAKAAGRDGVAEFRDSEVVTLDAVEAEVRSLSSRVIPGGGR